MSKAEPFSLYRPAGPNWLGRLALPASRRKSLERKEPLFWDSFFEAFLGHFGHLLRVIHVFLNNIPNFSCIYCLEESVWWQRYLELKFVYFLKKHSRKTMLTKSLEAFSENLHCRRRTHVYDRSVGRIVQYLNYFRHRSSLKERRDVLGFCSSLCDKSQWQSLT